MIISFCCSVGSTGDVKYKKEEVTSYPLPLMIGGQLQENVSYTKMFKQNRSLF